MTLSSGDVRDGPRYLLLDVGFGMAEERGEKIQGLIVQDHLSLMVTAGDNVANSTQSWSLGGRGGREGGRGRGNDCKVVPMF